MKNEEIERQLAQRGVKPTAMRILVYRELAHTHHPLSLRELEERMDTAERSTIFRTLTLLAKHHVVHSIEDGSGSLKYEICHGHEHCSIEDQHTHFYCEHCQRTFCMPNTRIPQVDIPEGFHINSINYIVKGLCADCASLIK